ncbi:MAG TPA: c-type cytochrome [Gemmatimonadetes bacterium]|nr:c-type cytochrome [Gemmatimonadota bacterium]
MPISGHDSTPSPGMRANSLMLKLTVCVIGLACVVASPAGAQQGIDPVLFEQGQQLYQENCALCHQDSGGGDAPTFPALGGDDRLGDPVRIVRSIHQGGRRMPPFPNLAAEEISSLANYIRNAWANDFGAVSTEEVSAVMEGVEEGGPMVSVWDGVFTEAQAERGGAVYEGACGLCHGRRLNGAPDDPDMRSTPPLARARFLRVWDGRSLATLFAYTRATMPEDNPSSLTEQEYVDVIAHMLSVGGMSAGDDELQPDPQSLARLVIGPQP